MVKDQVVDIALVALGELDDLELGHQQFGQRNRQRLALQPIGDGHLVAHRELPYEDIQLVAPSLLVEKQAPRPMKGVEHLIRRIPGSEQHDGDCRPRAALRDKVDVVDRAGEEGAARWRLEVHGHATEQAHAGGFEGDGGADEVAVELVQRLAADGRRVGPAQVQEPGRGQPSHDAEDQTSDQPLAPGHEQPRRGTAAGPAARSGAG